MKLYLSVLLFVSFGTGLVASQNAKTYHVITNQKLAWHKALHYCHNLGWRLASITSKAENDQLEKQLIESGKEHFWIGGTMLGNEPYFYWAGNTKPITFSNWHSHGEPNNYHLNEDCIEIWYLNGLYKWNDSSCDRKEHFVCEETMNVKLL